MWELLSKVLKRSTPPIGDPIEESAGRFADWLKRQHGDPAVLDLACFDRALEAAARPGTTLAEGFSADAASWLGRELRTRHGGTWAEHPVAGYGINGPGDVAHLWIPPLAIVEKKWELKAAFPVAEFVAAIPKRIEAERAAGDPGELLPHPWATLRDRPEGAFEGAEAFRAWWKTRHNSDLPLSLVGVRELDRFLRTHYYLFGLSEGLIACAGLYVGEVARGLFGGTWQLVDAEEPHEARLRYPELDYHPVGRLYRMLMERPERSPLDEYLRLIPSARAELRKQAATPTEHQP